MFSFQTPHTEAQWKSVAAGFQSIWNFPHVVGALDGKHIRITCPPGSGSYYFNYKKYYSIVMLGVVNAQCEFIYVFVGAEGRASDGGIWKQCKLYRDLHNPTNPLSFPGPDNIDGIEEEIPYFLVADDAFALSPNLLKPFSARGLTKKARIFNYRLSRSRMCIENAFGVLASKFRIFRREIEMLPAGAEKVVLAAAALHNMLRRECGKTYMPTRILDHEIEDGARVPGRWRSEVQLDDIERSRTRNASEEAKALRELLGDYFISRSGEMTGQYVRAHVN